MSMVAMTRVMNVDGCKEVCQNNVYNVYNVLLSLPAPQGMRRDVFYVDIFNGHNDKFSVLIFY